MAGGELLGPAESPAQGADGRFTVSQIHDTAWRANRNLPWMMRRLAEYAAQVREWLEDKEKRGLLDVGR